MSKNSAFNAKGSGPSQKSISAAKRDAAWLERIKTEKDAQALSDLFEIYRPKLKGWLMARGVGSGTAEDIVQDVMIKVWTRAVLFDPAKASFATWVYRLTRNKFMTQESTAILREHIRRLTEAQQTAIRMAFLEFKTHKQISAEIGLPLGTVKTRIRSAINALKTNMARQQDDLL